MATRRRRAQDDADLQKALEQSKQEQMSDLLEDSEEEEEKKGNNQRKTFKKSSNLDDSDGIGDPDFGDDDQSGSNGETNGSLSVRARRENALQRKRKTPSIHDPDETAVNPIDKWTKSKPKMDVKVKRKLDPKEEEKSSGNDTTIPKKKIPKKTQETGEGIKSSLIDKLAPVPPTQAQPTLKSKGKSTSPIPAPKSPPRPKANTEVKTDKKQAPPPQVIAVPDVVKPSVEVKTVTHNGAKKALVALVEKRVMESLAQVCETCRSDPSFKISDRFTPNLSGSFLGKEEDNLDFFDLNEKGEIVIPPMLPIFPEEFPPGMKEHTLAWWGIVDPALGDGRFRLCGAEEQGQSQRSAGENRGPGQWSSNRGIASSSWGQQRPKQEPSTWNTNRQVGPPRGQGSKRTF